MATNDLLLHLRDLEVVMHQPKLRSDVDKLDELLHESFTEFGRSGRSYSRTDILMELPLEDPSVAIWSDDFSVAEVADGVALLTYKSAHIDNTGQLSRYTLRSSLWQRTSRGWQMRFHQGTPTDIFE
jgi:hypothetical protein